MEKNDVINDILDRAREDGLVVRKKGIGEYKIFPDHECPNYVSVRVSDDPFGDSLTISVGYKRDGEPLDQRFQIKSTGYEESMNMASASIKYLANSCLEIAKEIASKRSYADSVAPIPPVLAGILTRHYLKEDYFRLRINVDIKLRVLLEIIRFMEKILK